MLSVVGLVLIGCARVHSGSAVRAEGYDVGTVYPALLDTGNYPTKPRDPLGIAGNAAAGALLEAHRLADYVVVPFQVDSTLVHASAPQAINDERALAQNLDNQHALEPVLNGHSFVAGFNARAVNGDDRDWDPESWSNDWDESLSNVVAIFARPADAAAAGSAIAAAANPAVSLMNEPYPTSAIDIPRYPGTRAWVHEEPRATEAPWQVVQAFTAHGPYVLVQRAQTPSAGAAADLIAATLDQQIPLVDGFTPTAQDQLANLPVDPSGLQARMIAPKKDESTTTNGQYGRHGALIFQTQPVAAQKAFDELGIDLMVYQNGFLIRAKDAPSARGYFDMEVADQAKQGWTAIDGVPGLPSARCMRKDPRGPYQTAQFWCAVTVDRVVFENSSSNENDVKQKLAAGYLMLTAP
ncbi:MAG: hypothetical protein H6523_16450 [Mycolicibacterium sp.]|uniref:Uncharacterized protein n=1 Tax=Mycolicibacterium insubricum TaxID=444597 RepID=A0A1X0DNA6_9MYCO|nr:hypothetical protein [Mycolicibacterium insubricum]MCB9441826.1 hypothetical protein [Mycolicibacterium sp.]MCV7082156.1 hypothetical protein [Mycolicibacterium insubricum]ORA73845.1 hypothetical protein BST26_01345 [Mycolicibacterium insubricum]